MNTNTNWQKVLGGIALASALVGGSAATYAADMDFNEWDADNSGVLDYNEWDTGFDNDSLYTDWDANDDGLLDNNEYGEGIYNSYDMDGDGSWNEEEYNTFQDDAGDGGWLDV